MRSRPVGGFNPPLSSQLKLKPNEAGALNRTLSGGTCPPPRPVQAVNTTARMLAAASKMDRRTNRAAPVFTAVPPKSHTCFSVASVSATKRERSRAVFGYARCQSKAVARLQTRVGHGHPSLAHSLVVPDWCRNQGGTVAVVPTSERVAALAAERRNSSSTDTISAQRELRQTVPDAAAAPAFDAIRRRAMSRRSPGPGRQHELVRHQQASRSRRLTLPRVDS
jgi:hypothetical protein